MPDVARLHTAYVWVPGGYEDRTNGLCINQTHGTHHWALQMTPVGQIDIHLQHAFLGVSGGSFGSHAVPSVSIHFCCVVVFERGEKARHFSIDMENIHYNV